MHAHMDSPMPLSKASFSSSLPNQSISQSTSQRRPTGRGILAFLPSHADLYPFDCDAWKASSASVSVISGHHRRRHRRRHRANYRLSCPNSHNSQNPSSSAILSSSSSSLLQTSSLLTCEANTQKSDTDQMNFPVLRPSGRVVVEDWIQQADHTTSMSFMERDEIRVDMESHSCVQIRTLLILFCFDPHNAYSFPVRDRLVQLLPRSHSKKVRLRVMSISLSPRRNSDISNDNNDNDDDLRNQFLTGTGFVHCSSTTAPLLFLCPAQSPGLAVYQLGSTTDNIYDDWRPHSYRHRYGSTTDSRSAKISAVHEELALEWNSADYVLNRWRSGKSGLSHTQQLMAVVLFPSSFGCLIL